MQAEVEEFIHERGRSNGFERLALRVFAYQYEHCPLYRRFCDNRATTPSKVRAWQEIPALPVDAYKSSLFDGARRPWGFVSSGTTQGHERRSRLELTSLDTYRASALAHFADMVLPDRPGPMDTIILGPSAPTYPESSLGRMFTWCAEEFGHGDPHVALDSTGTADIESAIAWLAERAAATRPVLLLGISSAFTSLFEVLRERSLELRLPADSRLVDTGGSKGAARVLSARGLLKATWRFLHVAAYQCVNEYGMTEMLSQFYDDTLAARFHGIPTPRAKVGPAWVRTLVVDPATLAPVPDGARGILRHLDLANWETVSALQTLDVGRSVGRGFEISGRLALAETRGCSQLLRMIDDNDDDQG